MNVLCLAPHPDDEILGCGGTLRQHVISGDSVSVLFVTSGSAGGDYTIREEEAKEAAKIGGWKIEFLGCPDGQLTHKMLAAEPVLDPHTLRSSQWDRIYYPNPWDNHTDHQVLSSYIEMSWPKSLEVDHPILWSYEIWTPHRKVNHLVEISQHINIKYGMINCYRSQAGNNFNSAILALNHYRGIMLGPNNMYAEAFG